VGGSGGVAVVVAALLAGAGVSANPAVADEAVQSQPFVPGTGSASSEVGRISLRSSGTEVSVGIGAVKARYAGAQGNAEAAGVDLGLLEFVSKAPVACGTSAGSIIPPGSLPERVKVSSGDGAASERRSSAGAGTPVEILSQSGSAKPNSSADAAVGGVRVEFPGLLAAVGGSARSAALLTPGRAREARADSRLGSLTLADGLVRLDGMGWKASHRTGGDPDSTAVFALGGLTVAGQALPTSDATSLRESLTTANSALAPLGLALEAPRVVRTARGIAVTPLRLSVSATPELRKLLAAVLESVQPTRTQLLALLDPFRLAKDCGLPNALGFGYLLADLALVVLGDDGGIDLDFGGATAGTQALTYANPLASGYGGLLPLGAGTGGGPGVSGAGITLPGVDVGSGAPITAAPVFGGVGQASGQAGAAPGAGTAAAVPFQPGSPVAYVCRSTHLESGDDCARQTGAWVAWLVLALVAIIAAADRLRARRSPVLLDAGVSR
jgi:hypothetical protein